jgi:hypothetical protein
VGEVAKRAQLSYLDGSSTFTVKIFGSDEPFLLCGVIGAPPECVHEQLVAVGGRIFFVNDEIGGLHFTICPNR